MATLPALEWKYRLRSQYLAMTPLASFRWMEEYWTDDLYWQMTVLNLTVNNIMCRMFPPLTSYKRAFLKQLVAKIEQKGIEVMEELYAKELEALSEKENSDEHYKSYIVDEDLTVTLAESNYLISEGTTGLRTWQAAFALADWCCQNEHELVNKKVLELGSGSGFLGIILCMKLSPSFYTFTDVHPAVLHLLKKNIRLNCARSHELHFHSRVKTAVVELEKDVFIPNQDHTCFKYVPQCEKCLNDLPQITIQKLDWNDATDLELDKQDIILASDVVYDLDLIQPFVNVLHRLLSLSASTVAYVSCIERNHITMNRFLKQLEAKKIHYEPIAVTAELAFNLNLEPSKLWKLQIKENEETVG